MTLLRKPRDLRIGDIANDSEGEPKWITSVRTIEDNRQVYEITLSNDEVFHLKSNQEITTIRKLVI